MVCPRVARRGGWLSRVLTGPLTRACDGMRASGRSENTCGCCGGRRAAAGRHGRRRPAPARDGGRRLSTTATARWSGSAVNRYDVAVLDRDMPGGPATRCAAGSSAPARHPGADAHRRRRHPRPGRGARPRRRRLPDQAVRLRRARRPRPGARPGARAPACRRSSTTTAWCWTSPGTRAFRDGPALELTPEGVRRPARAAARRRPGRQRRGPAGAGLGRARRPVHQRRAGHRHDVAPQARRPAGRSTPSRASATGSGTRCTCTAAPGS